MGDKAKTTILIMFNVALILLYLNTPQICPPDYVSENLAEYRSIAENLILVRDSLKKDYPSKGPLSGNMISIVLNEKALEELNQKPGYSNVLSSVNSKMKLRGFTLTADNKVYLRLDSSSSFLLGERIFEMLIYSNQKTYSDSEENTEVKEICCVRLDSVMLYRREKVFD